MIYLAITLYLLVGLGLLSIFGANVDLEPEVKVGITGWNALTFLLIWPLIFLIVCVLTIGISLDSPWVPKRYRRGAGGVDQ